MRQRVWAWLTWQIQEAGQREAQRRVGVLVGHEARDGEALRRRGGRA